MAVLFANNAAGTIAGSVTSSQTTISLQSGDGGSFPDPSGGDWFPVTGIRSTGELEIMKCTARSGDVLTVERGQDGTQGISFSAGDRMELRVTASLLRELQLSDAELLSRISAIDGPGSGINADFLDGQQGSYYLDYTNLNNTPTIPTVNNATVTLAAGSGLSGGGDHTTNQGSNETITISHADTSSQASVNNSGDTVIQDITLDTYGHITGINSKTISGVSTSYGEVGTPLWASTLVSPGTTMSAGTTKWGGSLNIPSSGWSGNVNYPYGSIRNDMTSEYEDAGVLGTWRLMTQMKNTNGTYGYQMFGLWVRVS